MSYAFGNCRRPWHRRDRPNLLPSISTTNSYPYQRQVDGADRLPDPQAHWQRSAQDPQGGEGERADTHVVPYSKRGVPGADRHGRCAWTIRLSGFPQCSLPVD